MAETPRVDIELVGEAGGIGAGTELLAVIGCQEKGSYQPRLISRAKAMRDEYGRGQGSEFVAHHIEIAKQSVLFVRAESASAGSIGPVDTSRIDGTSVVTFSGTPHDEEAIQVVCVKGGTIGAAGITIKVSRDGGRTFSQPFGLGTANSYAIGDSGVTVSFAAGTLVEGDLATAHCSPPAWNGTGIAEAVDRLGSYATQPRHALILGDVPSQAEVLEIQSAVTAYEAKYGRKLSVFFNLRDQFAPAAMQGEPSDIDFAADDTITRNTGSWVTDGFKPGMTITVVGSASNDGTHVVTTVTSTVLTVASSPGLVLEANVDGAGLSITGLESKTSWVAALGLITQGATPQGGVQNYRLFARGGRARRVAPGYGHAKRRPMAWFEASRTMQHDLHISAMATEYGALPGVTITTLTGELEEYDQRVDGGLLQARIGCLQTHDEMVGVYVSTPVTLAEDGSALSLVPAVAVGQLGCRVAKKALTQRLGKDVVAQPGTGFVAPVSADRIEIYANSQLKAALLTAGKEGPRAVAVNLELSRVTDIRPRGTALPYTVTIDGYAYIERFDGTMSISPGAR